MKYHPKFIGVLLAVLSAALYLGPAAAGAAEPKPNILLIIADDLNDWIGPLGGHPQVKTPNLDKLAARGVTFRSAHCAAPLCNPSRTAFLSGMRALDDGHLRQPAGLDAAYRHAGSV